MAETKLTIFHLDDGRELRGGQRQLLYLVKELNKLGHVNHIVCRKHSPLWTIARRKNYSVISLPYFFEWDPVSAYLLRGHIKKALKDPTAAGNFPVLHAHTSHTAAISFLASIGMPVIRIAHRRVDFVPNRGLSARLKYEKAHRVIAISKAVKDIMLSLGISEDKITIVNSTIDLDETPWADHEFDEYRQRARHAISQKFDIPMNMPWIGSLIALVPHKDPENFARSAALVLKRHPGTHFLLAGAGVLTEHTKHIAKSLDISANFHMLGYYEIPYELLAALDIFVLPSCEEGMGSVLIEAMNSRLPIVATKAGGITDVIENGANGLIVGIKDPAELANAQANLLDDPQLKHKIAEEGHRRRVDFSSPKMAELTLRIYEQEIENLKHHRHTVE